MGEPFKALADPTRRRILQLLNEGDLTAGEIAEHFEMTKPSVSHHLAILKQGKAAGFRILQFNAVVAANVHARHLYERLGFRQIGTIPQGFRMKDGHYEDICPYYHEL